MKLFWPQTPCMTIPVSLFLCLFSISFKHHCELFGFEPSIHVIFHFSICFSTIPSAVSYNALIFWYLENNNSSGSLCGCSRFFRVNWLVRHYSDCCSFAKCLKKTSATNWQCQQKLIRVLSETLLLSRPSLCWPLTLASTLCTLLALNSALNWKQYWAPKWICLWLLMPWRVASTG